MTLQHLTKQQCSLALTLVGGLMAATSGCQQYAKITWDKPAPTAIEKKTPLAVGDLAELKRRSELWDRCPTEAVIGKHTVTVFALPAGNINTHESTPLKQSFASAVRDALEAVGYELIPADNAPAAAPVLRGEVNACWWWSYSWFWPVVVQGGENKVTLVLESREGQRLWQRTFSRIQPGVAPGVACAFDLMIKSSMTKLVQDIVRACSSDEFKVALGEAATAVPTAAQ